MHSTQLTLNLRLVFFFDCSCTADIMGCKKPLLSQMPLLVVADERDSIHRVEEELPT